MTETKKSVGMLLIAMILGTVSGAAASIFVAGESLYGWDWWTRFSSALLASPILVTIGLMIAKDVLSMILFGFICLGAVLSCISFFVGVVGIERFYPRPQWVMFVGTFLWNLGNAAVFEVSMGV